MEKYITKNGIKYELRGEQYYPMLEISEQTNYEIGKHGHLHLDFIKKHRRGTYTTLPTIYLSHHSVELFFKMVKVDIYNILGLGEKDIDIVELLLPTNIKELHLASHKAGG